MVRSGIVLVFFVTFASYGTSASDSSPFLSQCVSQFKELQSCKADLFIQKMYSGTNQWLAASLQQTAAESAACKASATYVGNHGFSPLYRYWNPDISNHLYTTNIREIGTSVVGEKGKHNYISEGIQCIMYGTQAQGAVTLHRYWNRATHDHLYTTNRREIGQGTGRQGYTYQGVTGYCYPQPTPGTVPLYRYWSDQAKDHLYTTNVSEARQKKMSGYHSEGVVCHVFRYTGG